jgi:hypothetical protein
LRAPPDGVILIGNGGWPSTIPTANWVIPNPAIRQSANTHRC